MKRFLLIGAIINFICSCSNQGSHQNDQTAVLRDTSAPVDSSTDIPLNIQLDTVIHVAFPKDSNAVTVKGHLARKGDPVVCYLPIVKGNKLMASLMPDDSTANIRISHIFLPNGNTDGPFGRNLQYKLTQKGVYKIYLGPNRMAGDPEDCDFLLRISVE